MDTPVPGFWQLYFRMFLKPSSTFGLLAVHPYKLRYAFFAILIPVAGYTAFYIMARAAGGSPSTFEPWLAIPKEDYFSYDIYLTFPAYYLGWVAAAATVYFIGSVLGGIGTFDQAAMVIGFGLGVATWSSMLHDLIDAVLSVAGVIDMQEYERLLNEPTPWRTLLRSLYALYFVWFLLLYTLGIRETGKLDWLRSVVLGVLAMVVFQVVLLVFIR